MRLNFQSSRFSLYLFLVLACLTCFPNSRAASTEWQIAYAKLRQTPATIRGDDIAKNVLKIMKSTIVPCAKSSIEDIREKVYYFSKIKWQICTRTNLDKDVWTIKFNKTIKSIYAKKVEIEDMDETTDGNQYWDSAKFYGYVQSFSFLPPNRNSYSEFYGQFFDSEFYSHPFEPPSPELSKFTPATGFIRFFELAE
jgi:hypothetical protein